MKRIFISYRRTDFYDAHRLAKLLQNEFGPGVIFFDTESMRPGEDWPLEIKNSLMRTDLMILIIGPNWLHMQDPLSGRRRIDMKTDWVRNEIVTFLNRKKNEAGLVLIPVLINGAKMIEKEFLDPLLAPICDFNCITLNNTGKSGDFIEIKTAIINNKIIPITPPSVETPRNYPLPDQLTQSEEDEFLKEHPTWIIVETDKPGLSGDYMRELYRLYEFENYEQTWKFISKVNREVILHFNHHPKWQNTWNRVEFWLSTFNIGHKPSKKDINIAVELERIWNTIPKKEQKYNLPSVSKSLKQI